MVTRYDQSHIGRLTAQNRVRPVGVTDFPFRIVLVCLVTFEVSVELRNIFIGRIVFVFVFESNRSASALLEVVFR